MTSTTASRPAMPKPRARAVAAAAAMLCLQAGLAGAAGALPQQTMQWQALAEQIVRQLQLEPGEKVISLRQPGMFDQLVPHLRYAVMQAGGIDLGVIEVLDEPMPEDWDEDTLKKGIAASRDAYVEMLRDVDAAIMLPGANPAQPAYAAMQILLFREGGPRRTIHFHWTDPYSSSGNEFGLMGVTVLPGHAPPPMQVINRVYQRAVLQTDLPALAAHQARFAAALKAASEVRVTTPAGTDLRFSAGDRSVIEQNGDASARRMRADAPFLVREVEIPAGVVRVAPPEDTVNGVVVYPASAWQNHGVVNARLKFEAGRITDIDADQGAEYVRQELLAAPEESRQFREFGLGFNPLLAIPADAPSWIPYFGYGAGIVRLGVGDNLELGGAVRGRYFRWRDLLIDATVALDGVIWVENGQLVK